MLGVHVGVGLAPAVAVAVAGEQGGAGPVRGQGGGGGRGGGRQQPPGRGSLVVHGDMVTRDSDSDTSLDIFKWIDISGCGRAQVFPSSSNTLCDILYLHIYLQ